LLFVNRIATTERALDLPVEDNRIAPKKDGRATETSNEAPNDSVTVSIASARMRLFSKVFQVNGEELIVLNC
jgi:hypothetical protein